MANRKQKDADWTSWALVAILFALGVWPVALVVLFTKLFGADEKQAAPPPLQGAPAWQAEPVSNRAQGKTVKAVKKAVKSPKIKKSNAKWLKILGVILLFCGLGGLGDAVGDMLWAIQTGLDSFWWLEDLLGALAFAAGGGAMLYSGFSMDRQLKRFSKYLRVMGDREAVPIDEIARTLGYSQRRVEKDLEKMIDKGYFGGQAYLNVELGYLFRGGNAEAGFRRQFQEAQEAAAQSAPPKEAEEGYSGILRNIRRANDRIADPVLSAKIDRLEEITAKIFKAVEEDPKKAGRIDTFLNYYLPTTQKLLDSYAQFEAAGVEGENLSQAKQRIEATMDSIVKGFEHQLDELYKADAMDVDSDIRVMEHMLRRDTGGAAQDFGLDGGTAVQREE